MPIINWDFAGGSMLKNLPTNAGDAGSISESERYPEEGNGSPLQDSCLGNPMDREALQATVQKVTKESHMTWWLNNSSNNHKLSHCSLYGQLQQVLIWSSME